MRRLASFPVEVYPTAPLLEPAHRLGRAFSPADAFYVALALVLRASLVTCDAPLARAARDLARADVLLVER